MLLAAQPTAVEQLFLEQLNDARANPATYGQLIGLDLSGVAASQPLAFNTSLIAAAQGHSQDMNARNYFDHNTPEGITPFQRMTAAGFNFTSAGESIAAGYGTTAEALAGLIIDQGVPNLGHRNMLLSINNNFAQVGVGIVLNGTGSFSDYYTIDAGNTADTRPFLTGVVFNDVNGNGHYDIGEGHGGVTVSIAGVGTTTTFASGGYSIQLNPGVYSVTYSGGGLVMPFTTTVTLGSQNVRMNVTDQSGPTSGSSLPINTIGPTGLTPASSIIVTGEDAGAPAVVQVNNALTGAPLFQINAFPGFTGGVRVAAADVTGDGVPDIIAAAGPGGGPNIRVFDGSDKHLVADFFAYDPTFTGGIYVAAGDVNGDHRADIITGADAGGGPHVKVFDGATMAVMRSFFAFNSDFTGGVRVAAGDINADGHADIITAAGPNGGPNVRVYSGATGALLRDFFAYDVHFTGGVYVAAGDINNDGKADIIVGAGAGGGPHVQAFSGADNSVLVSFFAFDSSFTGGVRVGVAMRLTGPGVIIAGAGPTGGPNVRGFDGLTLAMLDNFFAVDPSFTGGVFSTGNVTSLVVVS
jgi:uncharacterized protein YkwD